MGLDLQFQPCQQKNIWSSVTQDIRKNWQILILLEKSAAICIIINIGEKLTFRHTWHARRLAKLENSYTQNWPSLSN